MVLVMLHASICWSEGWAGTSFEPGVAHVARFGKGDVHLQGVPERHRSCLLHSVAQVYVQGFGQSEIFQLFGNASPEEIQYFVVAFHDDFSVHT